MWHEWEKASIGQLAQSYAGGTPARSISRYYNGNIPWVKSGELNLPIITDTEEKISEEAILNSNAKWVPEKTPLVAMYGATAGVVSWLAIRATTNQAVLALLPNKRIHGKFLFWKLKSENLLSSLQGSGQNNLSKKVIDDYPITLPTDPDEQKAITEVLDTVDEAIATTQAMLEKQDKIKDGLLQDLLTHGVDASGKLRKKHQPLNATLADVVSLVNHKIAVGKDPNLPYVGLEHIDKKNLHISRFGHAFDSVSTNNVFAPDDILFGKLRPNLRKCALAENHGYCSTDILVLRANAEVNPLFALYVCSSEPVFYEAIKSTEGTKMPRTSWATIKGVPVFLPDRVEQDRIVNVVAAHLEKNRNTENELIKLKNLKVGLMQDLLTGKKRVPSAWREAA